MAESGREMTMEEQLHQLRKDIDVNIKKTAEYKLPDIAFIREIAIAYTKLQEAKMWVGKCLEVINSPFPEELRDEAETK